MTLCHLIIVFTAAGYRCSERMVADTVFNRQRPFLGEPSYASKFSFSYLVRKTTSSATTEKQRFSCACLPRLANWSCNAQNTAESQRLYYFWHSNALIQEVLAENAFWHQIAAQDHSRSSTLQSVTGRQRVACRHILLLAVSLKIPKKYPLKSPKIAVVFNPISFDAPTNRKPHEYPHKPYISRN